MPEEIIIPWTAPQALRTVMGRWVEIRTSMDIVCSGKLMGWGYYPNPDTYGDFYLEFEGWSHSLTLTSSRAIQYTAETFTPRNTSP